MSLAPIGISTYSRLGHLKQTIESLQKNTLSKQNELYVFSDAPKKGDEEIVAKVRKYIHTVDGFKKVHIIERESNSRVFNNRDGMRHLLDEHGRMIFMEDDNVVSTSFLQFMNDGLDFYKDDKSIMSISGFNVPAEYPTFYASDCYISRYFNGWGFATWGDRGFLDIIKYNGQYAEILADKKLYKKIKKAHPILISGLKKIHEGTLNAGDYKMVFHLIKNDLYVIRPIKSFVDNMGHDGSGEHCGVSDRFQNSELNTRKIEFIRDLEYDRNLDKQFYLFFHSSISFITRIINKLKRSIK